MSECVISDPFAYDTFNAFFTRRLLPDVRPQPSNPLLISSPVDGELSQFGRIQDHKLLQAKGHTFNLIDLLGSDKQMGAHFTGGSFATFYLAPKDYHRVHMPFDGQLQKMIHVPGQLFSVNLRTARVIPNLFARNERVICLFNTKYGPMAVILVGAFLVASVSTVWHDLITPPKQKQIRSWDYGVAGAPAHFLDRGSELGHFQLGSTVITLFPASMCSLLPSLQLGKEMHVGEPIGEIVGSS
jgi:phosphatidylserine decarboxylase